MAVRIAQQQAEAPQRLVEADAPTHDPLFAPVAGRTRLFEHLPIRLSQYLELVAWSGKVSIHAPPESSSAVPRQKSVRAPVETLRTLFDCDPGEWLKGFTAFQDRWRLAGSGQAVRKWLDQHQRHWMRSSKRRRRAADKTTPIAGTAPSTS